MKNKLAIFDFDGTLFNTDDVNFRSYSEALKPFGVLLSREHFVKNCNGKHYTTFVPELLSAAGDDPALMLEHMEKVHDVKKWLYSSFLSFAKKNDHLFDVIDGIREKYNIALVTTASAKNTFEMLDHFGVREKFELILTQEDIKKPKPDPEGFLKAMEHFKASAENTVIYEDSDVGIEAAEKTGALVIVVDRWN